MVNDRASSSAAGSWTTPSSPPAAPSATAMSSRSSTISTASAPFPSRARRRSRASATPRRASRSATAGMLNAVGLQNPGVRRGDRRGAAEAAAVSFTSRSWPTSAAFRSRNTPRPAARLDACGAGRLAGGQHQLPERTRRRHEPSAPIPKAAAAVTRAVKDAVTRKPVYHEALAQRHRHRRHREGLRGRGRRRAQPHQHAAWHAHRPAQQASRVLANKIGGFSGPAIFPVALRMVWQVYEAVRHPHHRHGRRPNGGGRAGDACSPARRRCEVGAANLVDPFACRGSS